MCFKAFRPSFRIRKRKQDSPTHQPTPSGARLSNSPQLHTPDQTTKKPAKTPPGPSQEVPSPDDGDDNHEAATDIPDPTTSNWKMTSWNATKLTLRLIKESADAFPPLKAVAGGLCELITDFEQTASNKESIKSVALRIKNLNEATKRDTLQDFNEQKRRRRLESNLNDISTQLNGMLCGNVVTRFMNNSEDAQTIAGLVEDIRDALMDYQISLQQDIYDMNCRFMASDDCKTLDKLPRAQHAGRYADRKACLKGTRVELLMEIQIWSISKEDRPIYWLNGGAGTGKTTISQSLAERWFADDRPGASFFFSRDHVDRKNIELVFPTLAFQLAYQLSDFRTALTKVINRRDVREMSLAEQLQYLLTEPLQSLDGTSVSTGPAIVIIIDALDECNDDEPESKFLSLLSENISDIPFVKFFITSRPESSIRSIFNRPLKYRTRTLILQDIDTATVDHDIGKYLQTRLSTVTTRTDVRIEAPWPPQRDIATIVRHCGGLFIYASTVVEFILSVLENPETRLQQIISMPDGGIMEVALQIDPLYTQVMTHGFSKIAPDNWQFFEQVKLVVADVLFALNPLSAPTLATLLDVTPGDITRRLLPLHSVLLVPNDELQPIRRFHKSFPDFLTDPNRCKDPNFFVDRSLYHGKIVIHCLNLMKKSLRRNICSIPRYGMNEDVVDLPVRRKENIGDAVEYACWYWTDHLSLASKAGEQVDLILQSLREFFSSGVLLWIEIFSIADSLDVTVYSIRRVQQWIVDAGVTDPELEELIHDCYRFVLQFFDIIRVSVPHIYHSALPFLPTSSQLRDRHRDEISKEVNVLIGAGISWNACIRRSRASGIMYRVTFSPNGKLIASDSDSAVDIFDAITGVRQASLEGHTNSVWSVTFSPDNKLIASGSSDETIRIWDVQTGGLIKTLKEHKKSVISVSFSPHGRQLASSSYDSTVRIWDVSSGVCIAVLEDHSGEVWSVHWSGNTVVSESSDGTVKLWDVPARTYVDLDIPKHVGGEAWHGRRVACSTDGKVASCPSETSMRIYDIHTGITKTVETGDVISSLCFSPKGDLILYGSSTHLYIRDLLSDDSLSTLVGQTSSAHWVCFSADGESIASIDDRTVKIWQNWNNQALHCHSARVNMARFSADGQLAASHSSDNTIKVWDATTGVCLHTAHDMDKIPYAFTLSADKSFLAFGRDAKITIWSVHTGKLVLELTECGFVNHVQFSSGGGQIVSISSGTIRVWDTETGDMMAIVESGLRSPEGIQFAEDGIIVLREGGDIRRWKLSPASTSTPERPAGGFDHVTNLSNESSPNPVSTSSNSRDVATELVPSSLVLIPISKGDPNSMSPPTHQKQYKMDDGWILDQSERRVCHVSESSSFDCHGQKVILGTESGNVVIMDFSKTNSLID